MTDAPAEVAEDKQREEIEHPPTPRLKLGAPAAQVPPLHAHHLRMMMVPPLFGL